MLKKISLYVKNFKNDYMALLANKNLVKLVAAGFVSSLGSKISYFAMLKKVYDLSGGRITNLGFLSIAELIPYMLFGTIAGVVIDRFSRKRIMLISDLLNGFVTLSVIFVGNLNLIYVLAFLASFVNVFRNPAQRALEPGLVEKDELPLLNSFTATTNSLVMIIGSALGAAVVGFVGVRNAFILDCASFWISAVIISCIRISEKHLVRSTKKKEAKITHEFVDGISIMWKDSTLRLILLIDLYVTFAMSMQGPLIYIFIKQSMNMGAMAELAWGTLLSALGIGAIVGSLVIGMLVKVYKNRFRLFLNVLLFDSVFFTLFLVSRNFPLSVVIFTFLGCIGTAHSIILNTTIQSIVKNENLGKVFSVLSMLASPISILSVLIGTFGAQLFSAQSVLLVIAGFEAAIAIGIRFTRSYKVFDLSLDDASEKLLS
jgi:MFS transporter, DHA3 family, macrolide efflux protein